MFYKDIERHDCTVCILLVFVSNNEKVFCIKVVGAVPDFDVTFAYLNFQITFY